MMNGLLKPWRRIVKKKASEIIGHTNVVLENSNCRYTECSMGNFVADAFAHNYISRAENGSWTYASIAIINKAKASLNVGNLTFNDLATAHPFENTVDVVELQGRHLKSLMETVTLPYIRKYREYSPINLLQVSGMRIVIDLRKCLGSRVRSLKVLCRRCDVPRYVDLKLRRFYRVVLPSFFARKGGAFDIIADNMRNHEIGEVDFEVLVKYIRKQSPITTRVEGRIITLI